MAFSTIHSADEAGAAGESRRLYLIEDDPQSLTTSGSLLRALGYAPRLFGSPKDFLAQAEDHEIGCVVAGLRMEEICGIELLKRLRADESCLAVILLTASADLSCAVEAMKLGAASVIEKPHEPFVLAREVQSAFRQSGLAFERRQRLRRASKLLSRLSAEETAVLELAVSGTPNRAIAEQLSISPRTVDRRRQSALQKLEAESVCEFAVLKTLTEAHA
jgi:two-component system response regulator FixJ